MDDIKYALEYLSNQEYEMENITKEEKSILKNIHFIPLDENTYLKINQICTKLHVDLSPYFYILPDSLEAYGRVLTKLGAQTELSYTQAMSFINQFVFVSFLTNIRK